MEPIRPPKSLLRQGMVKSVGVFLLGVAGIITSVTTAVAIDTARDNQSESQCRGALANETSRLQGEISLFFSDAVLKARTATPEDQAAMRDELTGLTDEWRVAQDRRNRANEICKED